MITSSSRVLYGFTVGPCHERCVRALEKMGRDFRGGMPQR